MDSSHGRAHVCLRAYQVDAIERVEHRIRAGVRRIVIVAPTGAGKSTVAGQIIVDAFARGQRSLFLAHRRELILQAYRRFIQMGVPEQQVGVVMGNDPRRRPGAMVQVASVDTLRNRAKPVADVVFVDEAHRALSHTHSDIAAHYPDAVHFGLTATPYRADGKGLGDAYDELVVVSTPKQLIAEGYLVEPRVFTVPRSALPDLSSVRVRGGDYDESALATAVDRQTLVGNIVEHWQKHASGIRTVAFAVSVAHSKHIVDRFNEAGVRAEHLDGTTPTGERDAILRRLDSGETLVVGNCGVLCLDEKTEILTSIGWVGIDAMTDRHLVANWDDEQVTFEPPRQVICRRRLGNERMVTLRGPLFDVRVTEGHRIVHRRIGDAPWQKTAARDLVGKCGFELPTGTPTTWLPVGDCRFDFDPKPSDERVWCVRTRTGNIITRRNGCVVVLGNCEGWDEPAVKCAILARPTKSTGLYLQQAGRILRPWNDQRAIILDHGGCVLEHGLPQDDRAFSLESQKKKRAKDTESDIPVKTCEQCYAVLPSATRVCPECGFVFEAQSDVPEESNATLVEVTESPLDEMRAEWHRLRAIAAAKGYKPGWAYYRFKDTFGRPPPKDISSPKTLTEQDKRAVFERIQRKENNDAWARTLFRMEFGEAAPQL